MEVIDLHAHVFNLRYIPVEGVLRRFVSPKVARAVYVMLKAIADTQAGPSARRTQSKAEQAIEENDEAAFLIAVSKEVPAEARDHEHVQQAVQDLTPQDLAKAAAVLGIDPEEATHRRPQAAPPHIKRMASLALLAKVPTDILKWLFLMTKPELQIAQQLAASYPGVSLFVHHMMDMDVHYKDRSEYTFAPNGSTGQVDRMLALQRHAEAPKLAIFTAWDPFRPDCRAIVETSIERGCAGVKVYPSNGFKPWDNGPEDIDPTVADPPTAEQVNANNAWLYAFCVERGVPIFAHCQPGHLEAGDGEGAKADPVHWRRVLDHEVAGQHPFRALKLCFGHGGGGEPWTLPWSQQDEFLASYAGEVYRICSEGDGQGGRRYPNTYCDFGMLDGVLDNPARQRLRERLTTLLSTTPLFARAIAFGTDWSMLYRKDGSEDYLDAFRDLFSDPGLEPFAPAFFAGNARRYLGLD
jgi:hypothetical protein